MSAFSGFLFALIKAIPAIRDIFNQLIDMRNQEIFKDIDSFYVEKHKKTELLLIKIQQATTNEEKIILFSAYNDIRGMQNG